MATKLNPGADATLVNVAYRAAMANTPSDYSNTLERAADSYSETMKASAEMWGNVAKVGASIGGDMIANAKEFTDMAALAGGLDSEGTEFIIKELYANKDAQKDLFGIGFLQSRETKQKKAELKIEQAQLFADIDLAGSSIKAGADAVAAGTFDVSLAYEDAEIVNAIIKSNLKNKVTGENNIARLSRNEETGELMYTMYDVSNNPDGEETGQTMTLKEFNKSIATNVKDGGAKAQGFNKYNEQVYSRGLKSRTGAYDKRMRTMDSNWIDTQLQNPIDLKRALHMKFGYSETSIFDDITKNEGEYSASLYGDLLSVTGGKNGLTGDIVDGIVDEGKPGINEVELQNSENYKILTGNLLGLKDPDVTRAYFKDYALKEFEKANNYGHGNKAPSPIIESKNPFTTSARFDVMDGDKSKTILKSKDELQVQRNQVFNGQPFQGIYGDYYVKDNKYTVDGEPISQYDILINEKLIQPGDDASKLGGTSIGEGKSFDFETHAKSIIGSGSEEQVVANFNSDEEFAGYTFTTEWELGGRAMNISNGEKETIIMLDKSDAWTQIQKFMGENKKQLK